MGPIPTRAAGARDDHGRDRSRRDGGGYALMDFGHLRRLEQWGPVRVVRPDPHATLAPTLGAEAWQAAAAVYEGRTGQGRWVVHGAVPPAWIIEHGGLQFEVKLAPSMHTGLFPEQAQHWDWMRRQVRGAPPQQILNLFAYTGGASVALAALGHRVTHVDASWPAIGWAQRNAALNGVSTIRWIQEDARAFVDREARRGRRYAGLLLDPPTFGHSTRGAWRLDPDLEPLLELATGLLAPDARFALINIYGLDAPDTNVASLLRDCLQRASHPLAPLDVESGPLDLKTTDGRLLPTGCFARVRAGRPRDEPRVGAEGYNRPRGPANDHVG